MERTILGETFLNIVMVGLCVGIGVGRQIEPAYSSACSFGFAYHGGGRKKIARLDSEITTVINLRITRGSQNLPEKIT